jgi:hypothetical protein
MQSSLGVFFGFVFMTALYFSALLIPGGYFIFTRSSRRRYSKEMIVGFALQLFWTVCVWLAVGHYRRVGNQDWHYAWLYLVPVNFVGLIYYLAMPVWAQVYEKEPNQALQPTGPSGRGSS